MSIDSTDAIASVTTVAYDESRDLLLLQRPDGLGVVVVDATLVRAALTAQRGAIRIERSPAEGAAAQEAVTLRFRSPIG